MYEKISVVIVTYNAENDIEKTLKSICDQSYPYIECIVKDGGSADKTNDIVRSMQLKYKKNRIKHIISKDAGIYDAMNQSITYCLGEWVIYINAGDRLYDRNTISKIFSNKKYGRYGVLYGNVVTADISGKSLWVGNLNTIKSKMPFGHQSCFVRKKYLEQFPFNTEYSIAADYNLICDLYSNGVAFYNLNITIAEFMLNGVSSQKFFTRLWEQNKVIKRHGFQKKTWFMLYILQFLDAVMKYVSMAVIPENKQKKLRVLYKKYIKKYQNII